jgi:F-type H+-transporting ATPase subunit b
LRTLSLAAFLLALAALPLAAAGPSAENTDLWKLANFAILAAGIGYLAVKHGNPYFETRRRQIRYEIEDARKLREEADARAAEITRKLENLSEEVKAMRAASNEEMERERARMEQETQRILARIQQNTEQEIASATAEAAGELRAWAVDLAVRLAEEKFRARMEPSVQQALVEDFARGLPRMMRQRN